jgi:hypothetical protein
MTEQAPNSYLHRYEQHHSSKSPLSLPKSDPKRLSPPADLPEPFALASVISKLEERVDGIDVKMTSLVNVVKLLQKYSETKDDQYEKEKENEQWKGGKGGCGEYCGQLELRLKEFEVMSRQFKEEMRSVERMKQ